METMMMKNALSTRRKPAHAAGCAASWILTKAMARASRRRLHRTSIMFLVLPAMLWGRAERAAAAGKGNDAAPDPMLSSADEPLQAQPPAKPGPQGRGPGKGAGSAQGLWDRLSEDERRSLESFTEEHFPGMYLELKRLKEKNRERFAQRMRQITPELQRMEELMRVNPEQGSLMIQERQLDVEIRRAAARFGTSKDEEKKPALRKQIRKLCEREFDCRHQRRALEIRQLEARLAELKARHAQAAQIREQLIEQEVKERLEPPPPPKPKEQPKMKEQSRPMQQPPPP